MGINPLKVVDRRVPKCYYEQNKEIKIEVAFFMSNFSDAAGAGEGRGKGKTPKEEMTCQSILGHAVKSRMTVIRQGWCAIGDFTLNLPAHFHASAFTVKEEIIWQFLQVPVLQL